MPRFCDLVTDFTVSLSPVEEQWLVRIVAPNGCSVAAHVCEAQCAVGELVHAWTTVLMSRDEVALVASDIGALTVELRSRLDRAAPAHIAGQESDPLRAWFERQMGT